MWGTKTLARARRRLGLRAARRRAEPPVDTSPLDPGPATDPPSEGELAVVMTRPEIDVLAVTLERRLGGTVPRLDSPARVQAALAELIERAGGRGRPLVVRSPAGLHTPEYWHIRIDDADRASRAELGHLVGARRTD